MKFFILITYVLSLSCNTKSRKVTPPVDSLKTKIANTNQDTEILNKNLGVDRLTGNEYHKPDSFGGRPASFYLHNPKVAPIAKAFYLCKYRPIDDDSTTLLLSLVTNDDNDIRPFYRWCIDLTIQISDGALAEYPGEPALKYAIKFPKEFIEYMDNDTTLRRYGCWTEIINYSGLPDYDKDSTYNCNYIIHKMTSNCKNCSAKILKEIRTFAIEVTKGVKNLD